MRRDAATRGHRVELGGSGCAREPNSVVVCAGLVYAYLALDQPDLARAEREALERLTPDAERLTGLRSP